MDDNHEPLPWDYFLTSYEKDLFLLPLEEALQKYPELSREQMTADHQELMKSQEYFMGQ
ncbi:MAG: hypothetical protein K1X29_04925 [Bdellovibrionales bacterium]|nr:hypothetical protein [Bdellovibrionales bacterium]